jgi:hypothetical protein
MNFRFNITYAEFIQNIPFNRQLQIIGQRGHNVDMFGKVWA